MNDPAAHCPVPGGCVSLRPSRFRQSTQWVAPWLLLFTLVTPTALLAQELPLPLERSSASPSGQGSDKEPVPPATKEPVPPANKEPRAPQMLRRRYQSFDPLTATEVHRALAATSNLWIVQFEGQPTEDRRHQVIDAGGSFHSYLPEGAYVVRMPTGSALHVRRLPFVRWVGSYDPAFRLEPALGQAFMHGLPIRTQRYNIVVCDKHADKPALRENIIGLGGTVDNMLEGSILLEATLDQAQLLAVANLDQVLWIDRWSPPELDMDNARIQGGADYVEAMGGYTGTGIIGHVYEGVEFNHPDFNTPFTVVGSCSSAQTHGHCTAGIVFGNGTSAPQARGMAPDAIGFFTNYSCVNSGLSRNAVINQVVNTHNCMFTTASWGGARTFFYTSTSADSDDVVFDHRIPWTQSQSNAGNQDSRP